MDLMHNQVINIVNGSYVGVHRVILDLVQDNLTILVNLDPLAGLTPAHRGRPGAYPSKPQKKKLHTELLWADREELISLRNDNLLQSVEIEPDVIFLKSIVSEKQKKLFTKRLNTMRGLLDIDNLMHRLLLDRNLGGLVKEAKVSGDASTTQVYKLFSLLCRYGFTESSLRPRFDRCGSPGNKRPCDPGGRKKPGARTISEKIEIFEKGFATLIQPGITTDWKNLILAADLGIKLPKPSMPTRCKLILNSAFVTKYKEVNGKLTPVDLEIGKYPNRQQIQRVLTTYISTIEQLKNKTTRHHFTANMRGLTGKSWEGVSGPGHTWVIDSTIGDIYLRSSVNRSWFVGRPIVYVLVDQWSTAVVGFYVCLSGPSWDMAKIALFCASANPHLLAEMYGYQPILTLDPLPTMPASLMCDRGEYLSLGASYTGANLFLNLAYAPPYRGDLKGLVEVLHRIGKDQQYHFIPGAIDARRKEYELRKFDPTRSVLTLREYTHYLYTVFAEYNLSADRNHRLDSHMRATDVIPTPAGLWNWGHKVGIGVQRAKPESELITSLLPTATANFTKHGVMLGGKQYKSTSTQDQEWAAIARNHGGWQTQGHYFPGSVSKIWVPNEGGKGMLDMHLSDYSTASSEISFDEHNDAYAYSLLKKQKTEHQKITQAMQFLTERDQIIEEGKMLTADALNQDSSPQPPIKFVRSIEQQLRFKPKSNTINPTGLTPQATPDNTENITKVMQELLNAQNDKADLDEN